MTKKSPFSTINLIKCYLSWPIRRINTNSVQILFSLGKPKTFGQRRENFRFPDFSDSGIVSVKADFCQMY